MALFRRDVLQTAEKLVSKGKIESAVKEYRKYLSKSPDDTSTLNRVGDLLVRLRKNDEAVDYYTQTAERYAADGFFVKSIAVYKKIQRIEPGRAEIHLRLAELYQRQGLISDARSHYQQLADHYLRDDAAAEAISIYERLVDLEPDNPSHRLRLADLHREQGQLREAALAYGSIANLMLTHGQVNHAFQVYERAFQVDPENLEFIREAITSIQRAGGEDSARQLLKTAIEINPKAKQLETGVDEEAQIEDSAAGAAAEASPADAVIASAAADSQPSPSQTEGAPNRTPAPTPATNAEAGPAEPQLVPGESSAPAAAVPESGEWTFAPEPELEDVDLEFDLDPVAEADSVSTPQVGSAGLHSDDEFELIEEPAPLPASRGPAELEPVSREDELLSETDVFIKYGLVQKALDRLREVLEIAPGHVGAYARLIPLHIERGEEVAASHRASELMGLAGAERDQVWAAVEPALVEAGYRVAEGIVSPPASELLEPVRPEEAGAEIGSEEPEQIGSEQPEQIGSDEPEQTSDEPEPVDSDDPQQAGPVDPEEVVLEDPGSADLGAVFEELAAAAVSNETEGAVEGQASAQGAEEIELDLEDDIEGLGDLEIAQPDVVPGDVSELGDVDELAIAPEQGESSGMETEAAEGAGSAATPGAGSIDLTDLAGEIDRDSEPARPPTAPSGVAPEQASDSTPQPPPGSAPAWLDEVDADGAGEELFEEEQEFFDLAAELQEALADEPEGTADEPPADSPEAAGEQSLEDIVEGFKKGVAENIADEESDTHYNLGIAYREMMLLDEAIGEFQISARDPRFLVDSCALLGLCFRDKGLPDLAVKWYARALEQGDIAEEQRLGLLYDLGATHEALDDREAAYATYLQIYGVNTNYRDISEKIQQLKE